MMAEGVKHLIEVRRLRTLFTRHKFTRLQCARNIISNTPETIASKDPAILIGLHWLDVGGAESLGIQSIEWALEAGLRVVVVVGQQGPERLLDRIPNDPRVKLLRTDRYLPRPLIGQFFRKLIEAENIVITHNHHCVVMYEALPTIKVYHPHVVNIDSTHILEYQDGGYPRISGVWSNFLDYHHVISNQLRDFYGEKCRVYGQKIVLGRLLDDCQSDIPIPPTRISAGQKKCKIAFVGRMVHQKRPIVALSIMRELLNWGKKNGVTFEFEVVGEGAYLEVFQHLLKRWRMNDTVHLHRANADVPNILSACDVMLLPSANEGLALVCYEAIQAGCIPISSNVGAQNEICPEETLVSWAPGKAVKESVRLITRLLTEEGFATRVEQAQRAQLQKLRAEPSAREVLSTIYQEAYSQAEYHN